VKESWRYGDLHGGGSTFYREKARWGRPGAFNGQR
jgi:hypothetical protein